MKLDPLDQRPSESLPNSIGWTTARQLLHRGEDRVIVIIIPRYSWLAKNIHEEDESRHHAGRALLRLTHKNLALAANGHPVAVLGDQPSFTPYEPPFPLFVREQYGAPEVR